MRPLGSRERRQNFPRCDGGLFMHLPGLLIYLRKRAKHLCLGQGRAEPRASETNCTTDRPVLLAVSGLPTSCWRPSQDALPTIRRSGEQTYLRDGAGLLTAASSSTTRPPTARFGFSRSKSPAKPFVRAFLNQRSSITSRVRSGRAPAERNQRNHARRHRV